MFNDSPWLKPVWDNLKVGLDSNRIPGALLLQSEPGLGAEQLVESLSHALLCQNYSSEACGFCHSCQLVQSQSHPDLHWIKPEKEGKSITVDQIRASNRLAHESSQLNGYRVFVIEPADMMNESASNALLKTLEEPGEKCLFLLVTHNQERLLPTIRSRCQQWVVTPPSTEQAVQWLSAQGATKIPPYALKLNMGSPIKTLEAVNSGELEEYSAFENDLIEVLSSSVEDVSGCASYMAKNPDKALNWAWYLLTDAQKVQFGVYEDDILPGAHKLQQQNYNGLYSSAKKLVDLKAQVQAFPGLNLELLSMNWLIESREALCS
ncbi:DNA polymerase III subunit delta' [Vibrio alginolyticus]|uniref:DNA polymerase III subunit delta' n=1 Tax=Vibrio sp. B1FLJ16 TaxID=2751178 RepID=UPI0015F42A84|nr:DNA polymerase III subunit delta' [Vibrio sp. B1FLJ16]CAD7803104.1 DNA polymerase III subunit delta [Vibrio sp. B1FLJ16]CAE6895134.1 DNA polymerase III subunit delta [Vibrio sp. B1FLJ16]